MNKHLLIARKASRMTHRQLARALQVEEAALKEMECGYRAVPNETGLRLARLFDVPAEYFLISRERQALERSKVIEEAQVLLGHPDYQAVPPAIHHTIATFGMQAIEAHNKLNLVMAELWEVMQENEVLRRLLYAQSQQPLEKTAASG